MDGQGITRISGRPSLFPPASICRGSTVYFYVDGIIQYAAVILGVDLFPSKWIRFLNGGVWCWRALDPESFVRWIGFREVDTYEHIEVGKIARQRGSWYYEQLDPSDEQKEIDADLLLQYQEERIEEWL